MSSEMDLPRGGAGGFPEGGVRMRRQSTMTTDLSPEGAAGADLRRQAHEWWLEAAAAAGLDLSDFDPEAPLEQRLAWARRLDLEIATAYARYSSKRQHSIDDQVRAVVLF